MLFSNESGERKTAHTRIYYVGDLNANMLSSTPDALFIKEFTCEMNLKLVEHGATNHVRESHTWIDVIFRR